MYVCVRFLVSVACVICSKVKVAQSTIFVRYASQQASFEPVFSLIWLVLLWSKCMKNGRYLCTLVD